MLYHLLLTGSLLVKHSVHHAVQVEVYKLLVGREELEPRAGINQLQPGDLADVVIGEHILIALLIPCFPILAAHLELLFERAKALLFDGCRRQAPGSNLEALITPSVFRSSTSPYNRFKLGHPSGRCPDAVI